MRLVADRFVVDTQKDDDNGGCALDLATGARVQLTIAPSGDDTEQRRWALHCDDAGREQRFAEPTLVDCGLFGADRRFEAWSDAAAPAAVLPASGELPAIAFIDRPEIAALAEMCERVDHRRPRLVALWGPEGSGRRTVVAALARIARRNGLVPVDVEQYDDHQALVANRTLLLIGRSPGARAPTPWLHALLRSPRPHVCVIVSDEEVAGVEGLALERLPAEMMIAAARLPPADPRWSKRVSHAAEHARGLPGRFIRALWPIPLLTPVRPLARPLSRAAETPAVYGAREAASAETSHVMAFDDHRDSGRAWPAPGELAALRRRLASAEALLAAGRHAPGVRQLRQVISGLARRDAWADALRGALLLAAALLGRGRHRDALRTLAAAHEYAGRGIDEAGALIDIAVLMGDAWIDGARLDEAERILSGAVTAARAVADRDRLAQASTSLGRCLFWRGAYAEAAGASQADDADADGISRIRRLRTLARAWIAQGDSARAIAAVEEARALIAANDAARVADVAYTTAEIKLAIGDLDGVDREVAIAVTSARTARQPMRALRAQLLQVEANRRRGSDKTTVAIASMHRLVIAGPPLIKARSDLLKALVEVPGDQTARRQAARTGLKALEIFGGAEPRYIGHIGHTAADPFVREIVGILQVCQHADDEVAVLTDVCVRVRRHLYAVAAAFVHPSDRSFSVLATDGPRMDTDVGERAFETGVTIGPHRIRERVEAAAAVQYGGRTIGALSVRWTIGISHDLTPAAGVLATAAAAAAPVLAAALARRAQPPPPAMLELVGTTPVMAALRSAVERAAVAPFAVLIEGESGSGKELVARAIHRCGLRRDRPFATLNCAALPDDLVEAELFGHARGSFTGAIADRPGVFEEAHGGTLLLDEVGELSARAQAKLLRVIQEGELRRIGENVARRVDVRIVCATNRDLRREVGAGRFRMDLLYRLDVIRIVVPPLRERRDDVPILVDHFWLDATRRLASRATLASATQSALAGYDWPGNVRELQNVLAALAVRSPKRGVVPPTALPPHLAAARQADQWRLDAARRAFEEAFVRAALVRAGGRRARAAEELGVTRQGLTKLLMRLGIAP